MAVSQKLSPVAIRYPQTFHCFKALPAELRLIIWSYNLPGPRIVDIKCSTESALASELQQEDHTPRCRFTSSVPVNLHVCVESRYAALLRYRLLFEPTDRGQIVFDPTRDTLYFGARLGLDSPEARFDTCISRVRPENLAYVRRIAINGALINHGQRNFTGYLTFEHILCRAHELFTNLEQFTFVCEDSNPIYSSDACFAEPRMRDRGLERDIQDVFNMVEAREPQTKLPPWDVRGIAAEPDTPKYTQEVMGYRGSRQSFFRRFQLPQLEKGLAMKYNWAIKT